MPDTDSNPYMQGHKAHDSNVPRSACPHPKLSEARKQWEHGWDRAKTAFSAWWRELSPEARVQAMEVARQRRAARSTGTAIERREST